MFEKMTETNRFVVAYTQAPTCYPERIVPLKRDWDEEETTYDPPSWTHDIVLKNAENLSSGNQWADVEKPSPTILGKRRSFNGGIDCPVSEVAKYDSKRARYLFPGGRTGLSGRGLLGRWGPNHAADPIVTRYHMGKLQVVLVLRNDGSDELAFPGGMVDPGATHTQTLKAEFTQEAAKPGGAVDVLFSTCSRGIVYRGPVDDWRTTDEAWIETHAEHFHATDEISDKLDLTTSDPSEVKNVGWYDVDAVTKMYASHKYWLRLVAAKMSECAFKLRSSPAYPFGRR